MEPKEEHWQEIPQLTPERAFKLLHIGRGQIRATGQDVDNAQPQLVFRRALGVFDCKTKGDSK